MNAKRQCEFIRQEQALQERKPQPSLVGGVRNRLARGEHSPVHKITNFPCREYWISVWTRSKVTMSQTERPTDRPTKQTTNKDENITSPIRRGN